MNETVEKVHLDQREPASREKVKVSGDCSLDRNPRRNEVSRTLSATELHAFQCLSREVQSDVDEGTVAGAAAKERRKLENEVDC